MTGVPNGDEELNEDEESLSQKIPPLAPPCPERQDFVEEKLILIVPMI